MKTVLITGATRNTGLAIARHFAKEGWNVAITSRDESSAQAAAAALAAEYPITARGYAMLPNQVSSIQETFSRLSADFGRLDAFVANSAHLGVDFGLMNTNEEDYDAIIDVNMKGTFFCCQEAAKIMKLGGGGTIVTIGSVQSTGGVPGRTVYGMSKASLSTLVRYMAMELGEYGIRANNVIAGGIHSNRWDTLSQEEIQSRRGRYPVGRESTEAEIANAVYFLSCDQSATISGTDLTVDSGLCACLLQYKKKGD